MPSEHLAIGSQMWGRPPGPPGPGPGARNLGSKGILRGLNWPCRRGEIFTNPQSMGRNPGSLWGRRFHSDSAILVAMAPREFRGRKNHSDSAMEFMGPGEFRARRFHSDIAFEVSDIITNLKCDGVPGVPGPEKPMAMAPRTSWRFRRRV